MNAELFESWRLLAIKVLIQALYDAYGWDTCGYQQSSGMRDAKAWLHSDRESFPFWCRVAGIDWIAFRQTMISGRRIINLAPIFWGHLTRFPWHKPFRDPFPELEPRGVLRLSAEEMEQRKLTESLFSDLRFFPLNPEPYAFGKVNRRRGPSV